MELQQLRILAAADQVRDIVVAAEGGDRGRVEIAFAGASAHALVGEPARELRRRHPGITPELHSRNFAQPALERVPQGEADIGLGRWDVLPAGVETRVAQKEELVLAVPATHALAGAAPVDSAQFREEPVVTLPPDAGSVLRDRLRRLAHAARFEPQIVQVAPDTWTAPALVGAETQRAGQVRPPDRGRAVGRWGRGKSRCRGPVVAPIPPGRPAVTDRVAVMRSSALILGARILRWSMVRPIPRISAARDLLPSASRRTASIAKTASWPPDTP